MNVNLMQIDDYEEAYTLWTHTAGMGLRSLDDSKEGIARFLLRNPNTNFVCRIDGELVGLILCGHDGRRAYVYHAVVNEKYRGRGIGKMLLNNVIDSVKKEGIHKLCLVVFENNTVGNKFWASQGFSIRDDLVYRDLSLNELNV
ncbi:GNAT family N-acetyltransferase [Fusibacter sp. JL216-2]|uniref:GNAT family N-acetyltransferase n=1 Tax=Fusibacter sp. JL216-2 TaxID=3071453 RepID=UPI003D33C7C9